jgi:hypothetical protein
MLKTILEILTPAVTEFQQKMGIVPQNGNILAEREALHKRLLIEELKEYDAESEFSENRVWEYLDIWWVALGWAYELGQPIIAPHESQLIQSPQSLIALLQTKETSSQFPALAFRVLYPRPVVATKYAHALVKSNMSKFIYTMKDARPTYEKRLKHSDFSIHQPISSINPTVRHSQTGKYLGCITEENGVISCLNAEHKLIKGINFIEKQDCL